MLVCLLFGCCCVVPVAAAAAAAAVVFVVLLLLLLVTLDIVQRDNRDVTAQKTSMPDVGCRWGGKREMIIHK